MLLSEVIDIISYIDPSLSKENMMEKWDNIVENAILPNSHLKPQEFVLAMHRYLHQTLNVWYGPNWNFFKIPSGGCDCVCSVMFIILCCWYLHYFPSNIIVGGLGKMHFHHEWIEGHTFILDASLQQYFETTIEDNDTWSPITELNYKFGLSMPDRPFNVIRSERQLLTYFIVSIKDYLTIPKARIETLLQKYQDNNDPLYLYTYFTVHSYQNPEQTLEIQDQIVDLLMRKKLIYAYPDIIYELYLYNKRNNMNDEADEMIKLLHQLSTFDFI